VFLAHGSVAHVHSAIALDRLRKTARLPLMHLRAAPEKRKAKPRLKPQNRGSSRKSASKPAR
jgi:hypothetical protein